MENKKLLYFLGEISEYFDSCLRIIGTYKEYSSSQVKVKKRSKICLLPNSVVATCFFDGATKDDKCGASIFLKTNEDHYFMMKMSCGLGCSDYKKTYVPLVSYKFFFISWYR